MNIVTKEQYEFTLARVEVLLPLVDDNTPTNNKNAVELTVMSDICSFRIRNEYIYILSK